MGHGRSRGAMDLVSEILEVKVPVVHLGRDVHQPAGQVGTILGEK